MADESNRGTIRAEEVEGLRELITQVVREERVLFYPRPLVEDMEELRQSPAGAVIRLEEKVDRLGEDLGDIKEELGDIRAEMAGIRAEMATKAELYQLDRRLQRLGESTKEDFRRLGESTKEDFQRLEEAQANFVTREEFRATASD